MESVNSDSGISRSNNTNILHTTPVISDLSDSALQKMSQLITASLSEFDTKVLQVRHNQINLKVIENSAAITNVNSQIEVLNSRLTAAENENVRLHEIIDQKNLEINVKLQAHMDKTDRRRDNDQILMDHSLFQLSKREQRSRQHTIKVTNFQQGNRENPVDANLIFTELIHPVLMEAKNNNRLRFVPDHIDSVCSYFHDIPNDQGPSSWHFVFYSRYTIDAFMAFKNEKVNELNNNNAPPTNASYANVTSHTPNRLIRVSRDLSPMNRQIMYVLYKHKLVKACKIRRLGVAFQLVNSNVWYDVLDPFAPTLLGMTKPLTPISKILKEDRYPNPLIYQEDEEVRAATATSRRRSEAAPTHNAIAPSTASPTALAEAAALTITVSRPAQHAPTGPPAAISLSDSTATAANITPSHQTATAAPIGPAAPITTPEEFPSITADDTIDQATSDEATALAKAILDAQTPRPRSDKRQASESPTDKPGAKKCLQPQLSPMDRRQLRNNKKKSPNKKKRY